MKRFRFPLESVLHYRRLQAEREEMALSELVREQEHWAYQSRQVHEESFESRRQTAVIARSGLVTLESQDLYNRRLLRIQRALLVKQQDCAERIVQQRQRVLEAQRSVKTLESLKEKAQTEWRQEEIRELDGLAADAFLARRSREQAGTEY